MKDAPKELPPAAIDNLLSLLGDKNNMIFTIPTSMTQTLVVWHGLHLNVSWRKHQGRYRSKGRTCASPPGIAGGLSMFN